MLSPTGRIDVAGRNVLMFLPAATTPLDRGLVLMLAITSEKMENSYLMSNVSVLVMELTRFAY